VYGGSTSYNGSTSSAFSVKVRPVPTSVKISMSPNPATVGQTVTVTAAVTPAAATGSVQFLDGSKVIGSATLSGGVATFKAAAVGTGQHRLSAHYLGTTAYWDSWSSVATEYVQAASAAANAAVPGGTIAITFRADGAVTIATPSSTGDGIFLSNVSYVTIAAAPATDIPGVVRPRGGAYGIGAYEA
jgi:hypothetical protein